jgi:hypothetical protein
MATKKEIKERYDYLKAAVNSFTLPAFTRGFNWMWFNFLKYFIILIFPVEFILMIIYNSTENIRDSERLWFVMTGLFFVCFVIVIIALISFLVKRVAIKKRATELGITIEEWNTYVDKK